MKKERRNERMAESQNRQGIEEAIAVIHQTLNWTNSNVIQRRFSAISAILPTGKVVQHLGRDGPPGRARSPGSNSRNEMPQLPSQLQEQVEGKSMKSMNINILIQTKIQLFTNINYLIMKKQILILVLFVLATFASVTKSYGQLAPQPVTCLAADALHPMAGTPYTYSIGVPAVAGTKAYTWFVTQDKNLITGGVLTATRETNAGTGTHVLTSGTGYNDPVAGTNSISITWKSFTYDAANPVFVVIQATNDNGVSCTTQNMKAYEIVPQHAFTLDIDNLTAAGAQVTPTVYGDNINVCISNIVSATWLPAAATDITYDYGTNTFLYEVVAANFLTAWNPSVQLTGIDANETVTVEWSKDKTFGTGVTTMTGSAVGTAAIPTVYTSATDVSQTAGVNGFVGSAGESIFIRVTLDHSNGLLTYQGLTDEPFTLAIDGITVPATGVAEPDVHYSATLPVVNAVCGLADGYTYDVATQTLLARPVITSTTVGVAPNSNPGNFLIVKP